MKLSKKKYLKLIVQVIILGLAAWVLLPQVKELVNNRQVIKTLSISWLLIGLLVFFISYFFSALVYQFLSPKKLQLKKNIFVQLATAFTNRLLPSGIGGISTNSLFLIRSGYKRPAAVSLALANSLIGFLAFCLVLIVSGALSPEFLSDFFEDLSSYYIWILAGAVIVSLLSLLYPKIRNALKDNIRQSVSVLRGIVGAPHRFILALLSSSLITVCYSGALYCCLRAAGIMLPVNELMLVFSASAIAVTISPTPNGLGAAEVSVLAALEKLSIASSPALAAVIAFRLISFWIPILPGYIFFRYAVAKRIV
jgi:undecaprenyl-diphosphatase